MKLTRLESVPDEVDSKIFASLQGASIFVTPGGEDEPLFQEYLRNTGRAQMAKLLDVEPVWRVNENGTFDVSAFGVLNGLFMHYCPGYRLMVTEGPNEPRRLWVCKEEE